VIRAAALAILFAACSRGAKPRAIASEDITIQMGARSFGGTLTRPADGKGPGLLLIAGSGPTDRDWNSPGLPGKNGSGKLIAAALARRGIVVLRYDKTTSGTNKPPDDMTYDLFRDEARAALALLRTRPEVDRAHLFVAGHSEGGVQALRVAAEEKDLAGVILLSTPGRRLADVMVGQLESQLTEAASRRLMRSEVVEREVASIKQGFADFVAGEEVDPAQVSSIPAIRQMLVPFMSPRAAPIGRPWLAFDPAAAAKAVDVPVLVVNGDKDMQVDPELDARALEKARRDAGKPVELVLLANANHVYKKETRSVDEIRAALSTVNSTYNRDGLELAPGLVDAIAAFVAGH